MAGRPVHLVDAGAVFRAAGQRLGHRLARIPDGETGIRANWIAWQQPVFAAQAALTASPARERDYQLRPPYRFAPGRGAADLDIGELGYHLCYGDMNHRHWKEPEDTAVLVRIANAIAASVSRPVDWIHIPVPRDRDDEAYFAPLAGLALDPATRLHLGLVHLTDGVAGARKRIAAAERVVTGFGIGTECGFGRRDPATVLDLLDLHRAVAV